MSANQDQLDQAIPARSTDARIVAAVGIIATAAALVFGVSLAVRPVCSNDMGYHVAYGEHFLDTGRIVQTNQFMYTQIKDRPADPGNLGPGSWFGDDGAYHFVNNSWISQVAMALAYRLGGMNGLIFLQCLLTAGTLSLVLITCRRAGVGWHWAAGGILLIGLCSYERLLLRPENFSQLILVGQFCLVMERRFTWPKALAVIGLQALAVNVHTYFLLGNALAGLFFVEPLMQRVWRSLTRQPSDPQLNDRLKWTGLAAVGCVVATLVNPWFVRGALMPIQTLIFLNQNHITGLSTMPAVIHPLATVGEFGNPFSAQFRGLRATSGFVVVLALTGLAGAAILALAVAAWAGRARRRGAAGRPVRGVRLRRGLPAGLPSDPRPAPHPLLAWLMLLGVMLGASLNLRRNIAPGSMILVPLALIGLHAAWGRLTAKWPAPTGGRIRRPVGLLTGMAVTAAALWWTSTVVDQSFYVSERRVWRFGLGVSTLSLPIDAAGWINAHNPAGAVFTDFNLSSNIMYLTQPHRQVPILTNSWAFPPYVMAWIINLSAGKGSFDPVIARYDVGTVVLQPDRTTWPLVKWLLANPDWALVQVTPQTVLFVRRTAANAHLADQFALTRERFDVNQFIRQAAASDPDAPALAMHNAALTLLGMGWNDSAEAVWRECLRLKGDYHEAMSMMASCLALGGADRMLQMQQALQLNQEGRAQQLRADGWAKWTEGMGLLEKAIALRPDYKEAQVNRDRLREQMEAFQYRQEILVPHW